MPRTTTIRVSRDTKAKLERISALAGLNNLSKTLDYAAVAAEEKLDRYRGNVDSLYRFKAGKSAFRRTSQKADRVLAEAIQKER